MKQSLLLAVALLFSMTVSAQYPDLTDEAKQLIAQQKAQWKAHSDSAWEVAFPIVVEEAKAGRPYVPWAFRPYDLRQAKIPAFPGAEGGGMFTFGGRGGKVLTVTNLNDDGPGSFRWACEQGGARIVVFNVSGIIRLKSPIYVRAPYITVSALQVSRFRSIRTTSLCVTCVSAVVRRWLPTARTPLVAILWETL